MWLLVVAVAVSNAVLGLGLLSQGRLRRWFWYLVGAHVLIVTSGMAALVLAQEAAAGLGSLLETGAGIMVFVAGPVGALTATVGRLLLDRYAGQSPRA